MGAIETLRDALFGNPPSPTMKPSREGVLAAFSQLQQLITTAGIADDIYETTAAGISATTNGQLFLVKGDGFNSFADLYKNNSGVATSLEISIPSEAAFASSVAVQIAALSNVARTGRYEDVTHRPALGTASAQNITAFATAGQGAKADTAVQPDDLDAFSAEVDAAASTAQAAAQVASDQAWGFRYGSLAAGADDPDLETGDAFDVFDENGRWYSGVKTGPSSAEEIPFSDRPTLKTLAISLFSALSALYIPVGIDALRTSGHSVKGIGAARYIYDASVDAAYVADHPRSSVITANGRGFRIAEDVIDAKMLGARSGQDSAAAIDETLQVAWERGHSLCTLWSEGAAPYLIEGQGKVDPTDPGSTFQRGVITSRPDVQMASNGAWLQTKAADHAKNGSTIFGHHTWRFADLGNAGLLGEWKLDGNMYDAERNPAGIPFDDGRDGSGVFTEGNVYQFQAGFVAYKSTGTIALGRITCINMRGSGIEVGMAAGAGGDNYVERFALERLHAKDVFREGLSLFNVQYGDIGEVIGEGNGFWVTLVNCEGHARTDRVRNIRIGRIYADFTTGLSPEERTPGLTNPAERAAARVMLRRIFTASHFYDGFEDNIFDGKWLNISIGEITGIQACMDVYYFANLRFGRVSLTMPHDEDLSAHNLVPLDGTSVNAIRCHSPGVAGLFGLTFDTPPRIEGHYEDAIWINNYDDVLIPDGAVVTGAKKSALRLDACSGRVGYLKTVNCGLASARAYAVDIWGAKRGLFIREPIAIDTRAGASRTMQGAVRLNGASIDHVEVSGARNLNTFGTVPVVNVGDAAVAEGNMDMAAPVHSFSTPVKFATVDSDVEITGDLSTGPNLKIRAPAGVNANLSLLIDETLQYQLQQTSDGSFQGLQFDGTFTRVDFNIPASGGFNFPSITYDKPLRITDFALWPTAAGTWRTKAAPDPTTDTAGVAVGDQTGA